MDTAPFKFAERDYRLAPLTLYKIGGPARLALFPATVEEACEAYQWMHGQSDRWAVLGHGSNVLIAEQGFPGTVLVTTRLDGLEALGGHRYRVEAGVALDRLVREVMIANDYEGAGGLTGIPGSVGGAIYMNAGTTAGTTCELLESVDVIREDGIETIAIDPSLYGYRGQTFCPRGNLIAQGMFRFTPSQQDQQALYDRYMRRREEQQPQGNCCGSVFKNPPDRHAGRLIEACGLKGTRRGDAVISPLHANFIMNEGNATFDDILFLIDLCKQRVRERFGITLEEEVVIMR